MEDKLDKIISLLQELVDSSKTYNGYARWSHEQEELVDIMHNEGHEVSSIVAAIKEKFDIDRSDGAVRSRINNILPPKQFSKKSGFKEIVKDKFYVYDISGEPPF